MTYEQMSFACYAEFKKDGRIRVANDIEKRNYYFNEKMKERLMFLDDKPIRVREIGWDIVFIPSRKRK